MPNANFTKAMKLVESGASGFKIIGYTRKLAPDDEVAVFEALAKRASPSSEAPDLLAKAPERGRHGKFDMLATSATFYLSAVERTFGGMPHDGMSVPGDLVDWHA